MHQKTDSSEERHQYEILNLGNNYNLRQHTQIFGMVDYGSKMLFQDRELKQCTLIDGLLQPYLYICLNDEKADS